MQPNKQKTNINKLMNKLTKKKNRLKMFTSQQKITLSKH